MDLIHMIHIDPYGSDPYDPYKIIPASPRAPPESEKKLLAVKIISAYPRAPPESRKQARPAANVEETNVWESVSAHFSAVLATGF